ncbi:MULTISPECIES: alpha/beta fold hydrolase [unclassified Streptomyces]|uniref:alpha/beta fold hydrolase n=1 Tax=unclassified Streptomyces TaxID=2593676 RepID=UPI001660737B|nr:MULTISPECIES: alpha/beta fold hydrolase [unclassified Streptomyces]MBD0710610.1 hydrolase [Streptomyces sp. CBMA291]MBD0715457.1 hydrolase [Streptomyces sp. CBMA370]
MDELSKTPKRFRGRVVSRDGTPIAYERQGDGPPVVLVSGALGTAAGERPLAGLLARGFSVVAYDRRGRGDSGAGAGPYAVEREIEDLAAVLGDAGPWPALHGVGTGGVLALAAVAAGLPVGTVSVFEPPFHPAAAERLAGAAELAVRGRNEEAVALFLADSPLPAAAARPGPAGLAPTLAYDLAVLGGGTVPERLYGGVHARVLVVDGGASPAGTRRAARALTTALPRARHRTLTGQTHEVAPHVLAPVLAAFLDEEREFAGAV